MCALPVRRIASGTLCAALLAGITGPAAMAAGPGREHGRTASPDARRAAREALRARVGRLDAYGRRAAPVADLLNAVLTADDGRLPAARAGKLGDAAKRALARMAAGARAAAEPQGAARRAADPADDASAAVEEAVDSLLKSVASGDLDQVLATVSHLLHEVLDLLTATPTGSAPQTPGGSAVPATTLPAVVPPAS